VPPPPPAVPPDTKKKKEKKQSSRQLALAPSNPQSVPLSAHTSVLDRRPSTFSSASSSPSSSPSSLSVTPFDNSNHPKKNVSAMPPPRLQSVFLFLSMLSLLLLLCYLSFTTFASDSHGQATSSFLFPTSAVISLTDDNSTFFISRPAAFGPSLPKSGLDGELFVLEEGQLACDDAAGWDPSTALDAAAAPLAPEGAVGDDDGTDNNLNPRLPSAAGKPLSGHADIQSLQQSAEIGGKIVLVQRGGCGFLEKVLWTQRRGGIALIVGDYKRPGIGGGGGGGVLVTMYAKGNRSRAPPPPLPRVPHVRSRRDTERRI